MAALATSIRRNFLPAGSIALMLVLASTTARAEKLQYGLKKGESLVYRVRIEAQRDSHTEIYAGTPSLRVTKSDLDGVAYTFSGTLSQSQKSKPGVRNFPRFPRGPRSPFGSPLTGVGIGSPLSSETVEINTRGRVVTRRGNSQLPFLLGNLSELMIELLPEDDKQDAWSLQETTSIGMSSSSRFPRPRSPFGRDDADRKVLNAIEKTEYKIKSSEAGKTLVEKTYSLKTDATNRGKPKLEVTGTGTFTFDAALGGLSQADYKMSYISRDGNTTVEVPFTLTLSLLSDEERKKLETTRAKAVAKAKQPLGADEQTKLLAGLKSNDVGQPLRSLITLSQKGPDQSNPEIARALATILAGDKESLHFTAAKALEKWGTEQVVPEMVDALSNSSTIVRHSMMTALANLKAEKAIKAIAAGLAKQSDRHHAAKVLRKFGPAAESAVVGHLKSDEWITRLEACKILKDVGTAKSLDALSKISTSDKNALVKRTAQDAVDAINKRGDEKLI